MTNPTRQQVRKEMRSMNYHYLAVSFVWMITAGGLLGLALGGKLQLQPAGTAMLVISILAYIYFDLQRKGYNKLVELYKNLPKEE